jgi:hypothetical protein
MDTVRAISGTASDLWAVGLPGAAVHFDGASWTPSCLPDPVSLAAVWVAAPSDVWAAGEQAVYRWNGSSWMRQNLGFTVNGPFIAAWGTSPADVWLLAEDAVVHFDGRAFTRATLDDMRALGFPFGAFRDVWGTGAADVWIAADRGTLHFDGSAWWASLAAPEEQLLHGVWAGAANDAWVVGVSLDGGGAAWRWSGAGWKQEAWQGGAPLFGAVRGAAGAEFFVTATDVLQRQGTTVRSLAPPAQPAGAPLALAVNDLWLPDARGVAHWNGTAWTRSLDVPR